MPRYWPYSIVSGRLAPRTSLRVVALPTQFSLIKLRCNAS